MRRPPDQAALSAALAVAARLEAGHEVGRPELATAVRTTLARLAHAHPGKLVEVRVPPYAAVQVGVPGQTSAHTRGTPPNVVETDPRTWLALASGRLAWADAVASRRVSASGAHADIAGLLPGVSDGQV
ncbi:MAG: sterol carrier family protein [Propionibacteriaceae bacterium]|nr:sterol carrier family protein [Propionibacteriaceae bacterium]